MTIGKLLVITAAVAVLCTGWVAMSTHPWRSMVLLAIGGSTFFVVIFGSVSRPLRSLAFSLLGAFVLSLCFAIVFNLRSQIATPAGGPVLQIDYLLGSMLGAAIGFAATLPFFLLAFALRPRHGQ